ncbi:MAG TPA: acyltransferase family protein [Caulobacteraceae bacterium]|nr:acyltransferase family protein [Caulobacteraceae bacterium]
MAAEPHERLHALDAVRGFALLAGIVFHATVSFLPAPPGVPLWIVMDSQRSLTLAVLFHVLHTFRMTTFFLIAGFFAHLTFHRRGQGGFIRDRLKRIALPLLVGWPILFASIVAVTIWAAIAGAHGQPLPPPPKYPGFPAFPLTHLWFLYLLLWFYAAILALRGAAAALDRGGALGRGTDKVVGALIRSPFGLAALAAPAAVALYLTPGWAMWFGVPTPDSSLAPHPAAAIAYFSAFGFGWLLHRQVGLLETLRRRWPLHLALAVSLSAVGLAITGPAPLLAASTPGLAKAAFAGAFCLASWTWTFAIMGLALRFLSDLSPARRYLADASYWLYLVHLPLIMALQTAVAQLVWAWPLKFALILGVAFPLMLVSYELLVRHSFIGAILNGRRAPRPSRAKDGALAQEPAR